MKKALLILALGAFVASSGTAFATGQSFPGLAGPPGAPVTIAQETFNGASTFSLPSPGASDVNRLLAVIPQLTTPAYTIEVNIGATLRSNPQPGAVYVASGGSFAQGIVATIGDGAGCPAAGNTTTLVLASATQFRWNVTLAAPCTTFPTIKVKFNGAPGNPADFVDIQDGRGIGLNLQSGVPLKSEVFFLDQATLTTFPTDAGQEQFNWIVASFATSAFVDTTTATIDVATQRKNFLATGGDSTTQDFGADVVKTNQFTFFDWPALRGCTFDPNTACAGGTKGFYQFNFTPVGRDFSGFAGGSPTIGGNSTGGTLVLRTWADSNLASSTAGLQAIVSTIDGVAQQSPGSFNVDVKYWNGVCAGATSCAGTLVHTILTGNNYTTWSLNGTILFAHFANGNTGSFIQRFYVCAPLSQVLATSMDVVIISLPLDGSTSATLASFTVSGGKGTLNPGGCLNIKLEDLLADAGIATPYVTDGGNLAVQFTFPAPNVVGVHQTTNVGSLGSFVTTEMVRLNRQFHFPSGSIDPGP